MAQFPRYAIYYAPAQGSSLDQFGAEMLGYDAWIGAALPFPGGVVERLPDWRELSDDPRKYGFHATLKAPMALADGKSEKMLLAACAEFASAARPIPRIDARRQFDQRLHRGDLRPRRSNELAAARRRLPSVPSTVFARP